MTDFTDTQPIDLTPAQWQQIQTFGTQAMAAIAAAVAQGQPPPAGIWAPMYKYIYNLMASGQVSGAPIQQAYWFEQAPFINGANNSVPSGYFVRDVTAVGMRLSGPDVPQIQAVSDAIGMAIYNSISASFVQTGTAQLPAFWQQLNLDIYSALNGAPTATYPGWPWAYPRLPIQSWGGTFYYWNAPYDPNGNGTATTPPSAPIGQYVLGNATANSQFVSNYSQAIANTVVHFESTIPQIDQILGSIQGMGVGFKNLWDAGWQGRLDIVNMIADSVYDYANEGGSSVLSFDNALINFVESQVNLFVGDGSTSLTAGGGTAVLVGGQGAGDAGSDTLNGGGGNDTFLVNLPSDGPVTETINDTLGLGQILVATTGGEIDTLGGSAATPLTAVSGQQDTWQDSDGTQYGFNSDDDQLTISGGYLGSGNEVVVDNFNPEVAANTDTGNGSPAGFLGVFLPESITLLPGGSTDSGTSTSGPAFEAGTSQSYTMSLAGAVGADQTITLTLTGVPASDFVVDTARRSGSG